MVEARAVLKAVSSSALTMPTGLPLGSSIVTEPLGVVLCELAMDAGGRKEAPSTESLLPDDDIVDAGVKDMAANSLVGDLTAGVPVMLPEAEEDIEDFLLWLISGCSRETIFIPTDVPVEAGINSVVTPFFLITVRCG
jgi:hypothetical protein